MDITIEQLKDIVDEAKIAAQMAATNFFNEKLNGQDAYACGFAWVTINSYDGKKIKGNTILGRAFKKIGVEQNYRRVFHIWNPSGLHCQNVDTKLVGAEAAAEVFKRHGFTAYADSRLD